MVKKEPELDTIDNSFVESDLALLQGDSLSLQAHAIVRTTGVTKKIETN